MGYFNFSKSVCLTTHPALNNRAIRTLWDGATRGECRLAFQPTDSFTLTLGNPGLSAPFLPPEKEFAVSVTERGVAISAADTQTLTRAFLALLMQIEPLENDWFRIRTAEFTDNYCTHTRMIHLCFFPETTLIQLKRLIRLAAVMQYTHVVIEFWGMLKYDCLPALSWENAFSKEQVAPLIEDAEMLGCTPIPMFNMLGHASGCRMCSGKHVVLDREPSLFHLFTPDGWAWNPNSEAAEKLLFDIRHELYELFGGCEYIHIGCDECWQRSEEYLRCLPKMLEKLTNDVVREGKRPIMWADMLLHSSLMGGSSYCCNAESALLAEKVMTAVAKETLLVDWQYDVKKVPVATSLYLKNKGFAVLGGPWYDRECGAAHIETLKEYHTDGLMLTTWHTLASRMISLPHFAKDFGAKMPYWYEEAPEGSALAAVFRRLLPDETLNYAMYGWQERQSGHPEW